MTPDETRFFGHPRGLATLFFTEMWERFSYYGMRAILILFMTSQVVHGGLGFSDSKAGSVYGLYTAMVYLMCLGGGWVADRITGQRRAVLIGGILIAVGEFSLVAPSNAAPGEATFYLGLVLLMMGTGMLKGNVSTMVGQLYRPGDPRRDSGFSIFYMGINLGAFLSPILCGYVGERIGWRLGFGLAGIGMLAGVVQYLLGGRYLGTAGLHPARVVRSLAVLPFLDPSPAKDRENFCDSLVDGLARRLATIQGTKVVAGASIGQEPDAAFRLEGSVKHPGPRYGVTLRMVRASDGRRVWSRTFERDGTELLKLEDEMVDGVAAYLVEADRRQKHQAALAVAGALGGLALLAILGATGMIAFTATMISNALGWALMGISVVVFWWLIFSKGWSPEERRRSVAILVLFIASAVFWASYEQAGSSLSLFAARNTNRHLLGFVFPASWYQFVPAIFVILLAPVFAWLWLALNRRSAEPSSPAKFALALVFGGLAFALLVPPSLAAAGGALVGPWWLVGTYFLQTLGELSLSPVGLSAMTKLAPARAAGFLMGIWFLSLSIGDWLAGKAASVYSSIPLATLFGLVAAFTLLAAALMALMVKPTVRLMSGVK